MSSDSASALAARRVGHLVCTRHPGPRCGVWAQITVYLDGPGPPSWLVTFTGGETAIWPVVDASAEYAFHPEQP